MILLLLPAAIGGSTVSALDAKPEQAPQGGEQFQVPERGEPRDLIRVAASDNGVRGPDLPDRIGEERRRQWLRRCPPVVFVKRHHFRPPFGIGTIIAWDIFSAGGGLYVFDPSRPEQGARPVFEPEAAAYFDRGVIFDMSVSYEADRLLFAWRACPESETDSQTTAQTRPGIAAQPASVRPLSENSSFHIFEINADGAGLRQITTGPYHDVHPLYLPDGKIAFVSTRVEAYTLCQPGPGCSLHVMDPDGSNVRRIHFGTLADHSPFVMDDGAILFTRWEYQDKSLTYPQGLWTVNPNGTRLQLFFGNTILVPAVLWQARSIPGTSNVLCTLAPHHGNPVGAVGIIDRRQGLENRFAIRNITPEIPYDPTIDREGPGDAQYPWSYRDPYPLTRDLFLVSYGGPLNGGPERYRLYLLNDQGEKAPLYEDPDIDCFNPLPLAPRKRPHRVPPIPPAREESRETGTGAFFVADVYQGMRGVERGRVKAIRVMKVVPKPCNMRGQRAYDMDPLMSRATYYAKINCGTAPVDANGSAYFTAPAESEIYFQALDADGKELCRMGSITQIMPGETQSCIGCHESRFTAPRTLRSTAAALVTGPVDLTPPPWGAGPVDFVRQVQPVFTKYCAGCHSGPNPAADLDLSDDKTRYFNMAYDGLIDRKLVHSIWLLTAPARNFLPLQTGSHVSELTKWIESGHGGAAVDDESRRRVFTWIDSNTPYYGTYEHSRPGSPGSRDAFYSGGEFAPWFQTFRGVFDANCGACHGPIGRATRDLTDSTWINLTHPEWSRVLTAPLAKTAGGRERCKEKNGKQPARFQDRSNPVYQGMLAALREGKRSLEANPRADMPGFKPKPYPRHFGRLFTGFAGP